MRERVCVREDVFAHACLWVSVFVGVRGVRTLTANVRVFKARVYGALINCILTKKVALRLT